MSLRPETFQRAAQALEPWRNVLLLTHERPDGDAMGCIVAMCEILQALGKQATPLVFGEVPRRYQALLGARTLQTWTDEEAATLAEAFDGLLICDTCARAQLNPAVAVIDSAALPTLVVDHHVTRDDIAEYAVIDDTASSASLLVAEWAWAMDWPLSAVAQQWLFVGMATDTGWFRFSNTDGRTLRAAARLLETGIKPDALYQQLYLSDSPARMRLVSGMLSDLKLHAGGRLAVARIDMDRMNAAGATMHDLEDLVNETQRIGTVDCSVLLIERERGMVKVSFRSKKLVDVAQVAQHFGGGGHVRASGARIPGALATVEQAVVDVLLDALGEA